MDERGEKFLFTEYDSLRQEVLDALKEVPGNEKLSLIVSGAYWAWLLTNIHETSYLFVAIWVPGILSILFAMRAKSLDRKFDSFHEYLFKVEKKLELEGLGWETYLEENKISWFFGSTRTFWSVLIAGNFLVGIVLLILELCV